MAKFTITFAGSAYEESAKSEEVEADDYIDQGDWITFRRFTGEGKTEQVLRVRAKDVKRIERVD